jgi:methyl-accepting chemotaxis protein
MFKNLSVAQKVYLLIGMLVGLLVLNISLSFYENRRFLGNLETGIKNAETDVALVNKVRSAQVSFQRQVQEWKNILLRGKQVDDYERFLKQFREQDAIVAKQLDESIAIMNDAGIDASLASSIRNSHATLMPKYMEGLKLYDRANLASAQVVDNAVRGIDRETSTNLDKLIDIIDKRVAEDNLASKSVAEQDAKISILLQSITVVAAIIGAVVAYFVARTLIANLQVVQTTIQRVAGGDFAARAAVNSNDEIGVISTSFNGLLDDRIAALAKSEEDNDKLNISVISLLTTVAELSQRNLTVKAPVTEDVIGTVADSINQLTDATAGVLRDVTKIAGVVEHASRRVKQQSDTVNSVAESERATVGKLVQTLQVATNNMNAVSSLVQTSNQAAADATISTASAMETVDNTVRGMEAIRETISEMEKRIKRLGERSQEISQIVGLINTISERTHVLSLNASMQAAMAGDAGRGFAVVAEEVQRLAENSRQATAQIANLVQNIQIETNDTIATVNRTIDQVVQGSEAARSSGEKMRETQATTERLVQLVQSIAQSTQAQVKLASDLQSAAGEISQSTQQTAEQLQQQNQVTASLMTASQKLVESVSVFKLPQQA